MRDIHEIELEGTTKDEKLTSNLGTLGGYTKRGKTIRARPKTLSFGPLDWPQGVFPL